MTGEQILSGIPAPLIRLAAYRAINGDLLVAMDKDSGHAQRLHTVSERCREREVRSGVRRNPDGSIEHTVIDEVILKVHDDSVLSRLGRARQAGQPIVFKVR